MRGEFELRAGDGAAATTAFTKALQLAPVGAPTSASRAPRSSPATWRRRRRSLGETIKAAPEERRRADSPRRARVVARARRLGGDRRAEGHRGAPRGTRARLNLHRAAGASLCRARRHPVRARAERRGAHGVRGRPQDRLAERRGAHWSGGRLQQRVALRGGHRALRDRQADRPQLHSRRRRSGSDEDQAREARRREGGAPRGREEVPQVGARAAVARGVRGRPRQPEGRRRRTTSPPSTLADPKDPDRDRRLRRVRRVPEPRGARGRGARRSSRRRSDRSSPTPPCSSARSATWPTSKGTTTTRSRVTAVGAREGSARTSRRCFDLGRALRRANQTATRRRRCSTPSTRWTRPTLGLALERRRAPRAVGAPDQEESARAVQGRAREASGRPGSAPPRRRCARHGRQAG